MSFTSSNDPTRRAVVTGIGLVSALGLGREAFWQGLQSLRSPVRRLTQFNADALGAKHAAFIEDWQPRTWIAPHRLKRMDRCTQFAVAAARMAMEDAGIDLSAEKPNPRAGVSYGTALGGFTYGEQQHAVFMEQGVAGISPSLGVQVFAGSAHGNLAIEFGLQGPGNTNANTCAAGNAALGDALRLIQYGSADVIIAGAAEAPLAPMIFSAFDKLQTMSRWIGEPLQAYRPFHRQRDGFVMGEGSAMFVVESLAHAQARGAMIYAELLGYGSANEAHHMSSPEPGGTALVMAMHRALADAKVNASDIDYINAHASGTPMNDANELQHIRSVIGTHVPVSGTKPYTGHTLGAAGAFEFAVCLLAMQNHWVPPTLNLDDPDPLCAGMNVVALQPQQKTLRRVLTNSLGFGGIDTAIVLGKL